MIVAMHEFATEEQIQGVIGKLVDLGFNVHRTTGAQQTILAAVGKPISFDHKEFELLPGVATAGEIMQALHHGHDHMMLFPAEIAGGVAALKALHGPFPGVRFCPSGGLTYDTAPVYLAQPNVACIGGSWIAPPKAVAEQNWDHIEFLAHEAASLARHQD